MLNVYSGKRNKLLNMMVAAPLLFVSSQSLLYAKEQPIAIAIHGGAGTISKAKMTPEKRIRYEEKLGQALDAGYKVLSEGGSSQTAVVTAIKILEDSPLFNAGKGAVYTYDERHELDASIMHGATLNAGAVSGVGTVKNPITLAEQVMENSVHVMLSGEGAEQFAKQQGLVLVDNSYFDTKQRHQSLIRVKKKLSDKVHQIKDYQAAHRSLANQYKMGTVGAVAVDKNGDLVAGTSTGGMTAKRYGRVGDSPIIGAGTYANNSSCAVSATGHGEYFIRYHVAADICARVEYQKVSLAEAANTVINDVLVKAGGTGGVVAIDRKGNIAMPFNTSGMYRASRSSNGDRAIAIFKEE